jgi:hypothetical protein
MLFAVMLWLRMANAAAQRRPLSQGKKFPAWDKMKIVLVEDQGILIKPGRRDL